MQRKRSKEKLSFWFSSQHLKMVLQYMSGTTLNALNAGFYFSPRLNEVDIIVVPIPQMMEQKL